MAAISNRQPAVAIEYDSRGGRAIKQFTGEEAHQARQFFKAKLIAGKRPKIVRSQ